MALEWFFTLMKVERDGFRQDLFRVESTAYFQNIALMNIVQSTSVQNTGSYEVQTSINVKDINDWAHAQRIRCYRNGYLLIFTK